MISIMEQANRLIQMEEYRTKCGNTAYRINNVILNKEPTIRLNGN